MSNLCLRGLISHPGHITVEETPSSDLSYSPLVHWTMSEKVYYLTNSAQVKLKSERWRIPAATGTMTGIAQVGEDDNRTDEMTDKFCASSSLCMCCIRAKQFRSNQILMTRIALVGPSPVIASTATRPAWHRERPRSQIFLLLNTSSNKLQSSVSSLMFSYSCRYVLSLSRACARLGIFTGFSSLSIGSRSFDW